MKKGTETKHIRTRIVMHFVIFGLLFSVLVILVIATNASMPAALASTLLIFLLFLVSGSNIAKTVSMEMGAVMKKRLNGDSRKFRSEINRYRTEVDESTFTLRNFMYYIAHVLRTPLNEIRWSIEMLKNEEAGNVTKEQRELLDKLEHASVDLLGIARELQDTLIVVRGDRLNVHKTPIDILPIIDGAAGTFAVPAHRKDITLTWNRPEALEELTTDPDRLSQLLNLLLDNAIRYTKNKKKIFIELLEVPKKPNAEFYKQRQLPTGIRNCIVVLVRDTGIGIPQEEVGDVFNAFYRATNAKDLWVDGKGVGLTLAHAITQELGGEIWLRSTKGKGTTVGFSLPR